MTVVSVKHRGGRRFVGVDTHRREHRRAQRLPRPPPDRGAPCARPDARAHDRRLRQHHPLGRLHRPRGPRLPRVEPGDVLALRDVGAYAYAMSSHFLNRPRPAEVVLRRRRAGSDDAARDARGSADAVRAGGARMKCIHCGADSKYKERATFRACSACRRRFAFEPRQDKGMTDMTFKRAIDGVSDRGQYLWNDNQLFYALCRRVRRRQILHRLIRKPTPSISRPEFDDLYSRWIAAHGEPDGRLVGRQFSRDVETAPADAAAHGVDRLVVCDSRDASRRVARERLPCRRALPGTRRRRVPGARLRAVAPGPAPRPSGARRRRTRRVVAGHVARERRARRPTVVRRRRAPAGRRRGHAPGGRPLVPRAVGPRVDRTRGGGRRPARQVREVARRRTASSLRRRVRVC